MPSRDDPFGEYDTLQPIALMDAVRQLQTADKVLHDACAKRQELKDQLTKLNAEIETHHKVVAEKQFLLTISARAFSPTQPEV